MVTSLKNKGNWTGCMAFVLRNKAGEMYVIPRVLEFTGIPPPSLQTCFLIFIDINATQDQFLKVVFPCSPSSGMGSRT